MDTGFAILFNVVLHIDDINDSPFYNKELILIQ